MTDTLVKATFKVTEEDLERMVLSKAQLPFSLVEFLQYRERILSNATMAENGFPGNTLEKLENIGRITGYVREFVSPLKGPPGVFGTDLVAATVAHLFRDESSALKWMKEEFLSQFERNVGNTIGKDQKLVSVQPLEIDGLYGEDITLRAIHDGPEGILSSTIVDFRVGCLLGVAYVVTFGEVERTSLVKSLAIELERQIVKVVLAST